MMKTNDYKNYDKLTLYVKKEKVKEVIRLYKGFNWQVETNVDNAKYEDLVDLTFAREHKIENKDELQLLQVYMEEKLNEVGKLQKNKHQKSLVFGLCFGVIGLVLAVFGLLFCLNIILNNCYALAISMIFIGLNFIVICGLFVPKIVKKEKIYFKQNNKSLQMEINDIWEKALSLTGGVNDEK